MKSKDLLKIGRIGLNINGDFEDEVLVERARKAEKLVSIVWIGDSDFFKSPFHVANLFLENTDICIGFGILRAVKCESKIRELEKFRGYEDRVVVGVGSGGASISATASCVKSLKEKFDFRIFAGATGKKSISILSKVADGMLLNHISPRHVGWAVKFSSSYFNSAYGPSLILPSDFEQDLILATSLVMGSSRSFLEEMNYLNVYEEIQKINILELIEKRQRGEDLSRYDDFKKLLKYRKFLLENFSISGDELRVAEKIDQLLNICQHVVLGDPFFRNENFHKSLRRIIEILKKKF